MLMKYFVSLFIVFASFFAISTTFAYKPTGKDDMFLQAVEHKIDDMFPVKINKLEYIYHKLDSKIRLFELRKNDQMVYLLSNIQKMLRNKVFAQDDVCIATYAQAWDTVEVTYKIKNEQWEKLREVKTPLAFNPTTPNIWKPLSYGVLGMKTGEQKITKILSYPVSTDTKGWSLIVQKDRKTVEEKLGRTIQKDDILVFGSTKIEGVVIAKVIDIDEKNISFDFSVSWPDYPVYLNLKTEQVNKFCKK